MQREIQRRRTFAIISHPDAGKTTLTEKLLLESGAINLAGSVTARRSQRATASDWMEIERQRGISISSTVLQFEYRGHCLNLLDTPGHRDFSEDTYRVLTAVDAAVMVIDAGKGIESQTRKLFEVCRRRGVPILTFINKLDRPPRDPLALLDELESVLGIKAYPVNWPLGVGAGFRGIFDRRAGAVHLYERTPGGAYLAPVDVHDLANPRLTELLPAEIVERAREELALLEGAGPTFSQAAVFAGELTPVFFGSAVNTFGVDSLLDGILELTPGPAPRSASGRTIDPADARFSGFVFKIQANMDPKHRDRVAFVRICSGRFERDMQVFHTRSGERVRLASSHRIFGRDRQTVEEAYPGDVIGLVGQSDLRIGDTLADDPNLTIDGIPSFASECFAWIHCPTPAMAKRFNKGLEQLLQEGVMQSYFIEGAAQRVPLLGAVGPLQFDVVCARLKSEYGSESRLEMAPWSCMRWIESGDVSPADISSSSRLVIDSTGERAILFDSEWACDYFSRNHPKVQLATSPPVRARATSGARAARPALAEASPAEPDEAPA
ncbi:MAG: peptide chain release factor 3 [Planctomycetota bacterium]